MKQLLLSLLFVFSVYSSEIDLVKQFFSAEGIPNKEVVYTGEMKEYYLNAPTIGKSLPNDISKKFKLLETNEQKAVYSVNLSKDGEGVDYYLYLSKEKKQWKIRAIRTLALPQLYYMLLEELSKKTDKTKSEEAELQRMEFAIKSDSEIKAFFLKNEDEFSQLVKLTTSDKDKAIIKAKDVYITNIQVGPSGIIKFVIAGITDNSVGFMYIPGGVMTPIISEREYIYIEEITPMWFIFKTT